MGKSTNTGIAAARILSHIGAPGKPNSCLEPIAEAVQDKQRANFCDYFEPSSKAFRAAPDPERLKAAADDLFDF